MADSGSFSWGGCNSLTIVWNFTPSGVEHKMLHLRCSNGDIDVVPSLDSGGVMTGKKKCALHAPVASVPMEGGD